MDALTIDIRPAELEDSVNVSGVHKQAWTYAYNGLLPHMTLRQMFERRNVAWWERAISGSANIMVIDVGGQIAGYTTFGINRVRNLSQEGEIYELYLRPEFMGIGLGRKLFTESRRFLNSLDHRGCLVWCLQDNQSAINFYEALGGQQIAIGHEIFNEKEFGKVAYAWS